MLKSFRADLHVHTCLSPCGEEEMRPLAIARRAKEQELDVIGICDHNSTMNVGAVRQACEPEGVAVIGGIEICSEEEVHVLGLFDEEESVGEMQRLMDENLKDENSPDLFGEQFLCGQHDAVIGREVRLLIGATRLSVEDVVDWIHRLGGLAVASHVDRDRFSMISQLGFVPEELPVDALEVSAQRSVTEARDQLPEIRGYPLLRFSDAHRLSELGMVSTTFTGTSPCVEELRKALLGEDGRKVMH